MDDRGTPLHANVSKGGQESNPIIRSSVSQRPSSVQKRRTICWHVPTDRLGAVGLQRARASTTTGHRAATAHYSVWASTPLSLLRCFGPTGRTCTREMHRLSPRLDDIWRVVTIEFRPDFMYTFLLCRSTSFVIFNLYCALRHTGFVRAARDHL